jgi:L-aspartate oxidase
VANDQLFDVLVIGSGAAGLSVALRLGDHARIAVLSKIELAEGSTRWAQGGIAAVLDGSDSIESHVQDTLVAGAGLCNPEVVRQVAERGPACIQWLIDLGVLFSKSAAANGEETYHLTQEGGHSHRRIVHAADATGMAVETTLEGKARAHPNIEILEWHLAVDLIKDDKVGGRRDRCVGAYVFDERAGRVKAIRAKTVVIATGGASKVYLYTSNPDISTGDGIAMAWRAGCRVANLEFNQFHPTCLYHPEARSFLISEAVRGEGGLLLRPDGTRFMPDFDSRAELAPRDIVARAIDHEMKRLGVDCVYLDISHKTPDFIKAHFPTILAKCLEFGIDMTREPIPVVPAAHYTCGGIMVDKSGRTDLQGLYAVGEATFTGLHGANRMASNSLLECLVYAESAGEHIRGLLPSLEAPAPLPDWDESQVTEPDEEVVVAHNWDEIRRFMWDYVGIVRTNKRLERAKRRIDMLRHEIDDYYGNFKVSADLLELRNLAVVADLIVRSAIARKESRGLHYTADYPEALPVAENTVLVPSTR